MKNADYVGEWFYSEDTKCVYEDLEEKSRKMIVDKLSDNENVLFYGHLIANAPRMYKLLKELMPVLYHFTNITSKKNYFYPAVNKACEDAEAILTDIMFDGARISFDDWADNEMTLFFGGMGNKKTRI